MNLPLEHVKLMDNGLVENRHVSVSLSMFSPLSNTYSALECVGGCFLLVQKSIMSVPPCRAGSWGVSATATHTINVVGIYFNINNHCEGIHTNIIAILVIVFLTCTSILISHL